MANEGRGVRVVPRSSSLLSNPSTVASDASFESIGHEVSPSEVIAARSVNVSHEETLKLQGLNFHPRYATQDRMIIFQVEETLFRVHAYLFVKDSAYFRELIAQNKGEPAEDGISAVPIIQLEDVKSVDFERFLSILYPDEIGKFTATTLEEWTSILHLASEWGFASIRSLAVRELLPLASPVDKVVLGRAYQFDDWLPEAFVALCERPELLSDDEAERMSKSDIVKLARAREAARKSKRQASTAVFKATVTRIFGFEDASAKNLPSVVDETNKLTTGTTTVDQEFSADKSHPEYGQSPFIDPDASGQPAINDAVLQATVDLWKNVDLLRSGYDPVTARQYYSSSWAHHDGLVEKMSQIACNATQIRHMVAILLPNAMVYPVYFSVLLATVYEKLDSNSRLDANPQNGKATNPRELLRSILEDHCVRLVQVWGSTRDAPEVNGQPTKRQELAQFVGILVRRGVLPEHLLRSCCAAIFDLDIDEKTPATTVTELCKVLVNTGKALDQKCMSDVMDELFRRFGVIILSWQSSEVHDAVLDVIRRRCQGWP